MTKPGDSQTKKTFHELAKEFPNKTYRELEKYRDADRQEEAEKTPLTESQKSQEELEPIGKGVCITAALKKDRTYPDLTEVMAIENEKLKKRAQEAEGELIIIKGIGNTSPEMKLLQKEVEALKTQLHTDRTEYQKELDRIKRENNDLYNQIASLTETLQVREATLSDTLNENEELRETLKSRDYFKQHDYKFLIEENHRLEQQYLEVMADNKKLAAQIENKIDLMRKSGM